MIVWTPALVNALLTIVGVVAISLVGIGQYLSGRQKGWRDLAEARGALVDDLRDRLEAEVATSKKERDFLSLEIETLRGSLALIEKTQHEHEVRMDERNSELLRLNHILQTKLDVSEERRARDA